MKPTIVNVKKSDEVCKKGCASREVLDLIADKWTVLIIHSIAIETLRHNEIARALGDISQKVLTQGLRKLERNGIITRTIYPVVPPRVEYALTKKGRALAAAIDAMAAWAERWVEPGARTRTKAVRT